MRRRIKIMDGWIFRKDDKEIPVSLPHTWNAADGQDGGDDYYRGLCAYRRIFRKPEYDCENERVYIEFDGVNSSAVVSINGCTVARHFGGYSTFRADITDYLSEENEIDVLVGNEKNDFIYPQKADFTFYGGIYRDVNLLIVSNEHFDLDYYGSDGLRVTPKVTEEGAEVTIDAFRRKNKDEMTRDNTDSIKKNTKTKIELYDQNGKEVRTELIKSREYEENGCDVTSVRYKIANPILWEGIKNPYLYTVVAELFVEGEATENSGMAADRVEKRFGIRSIHVDPEKGFFLNGKSYPLHGVSRHQDFKGLGNAIPKEQHDEDMKLIKEIGANSIRLAHYQHDQHFYDLCDETGMIVWAEIPYISEHMPNGRANTISQMKELIAQNYHHPSIVTWGLSNEITISITKERDMLENHHVLNDLCHEMDNTRPTSLACYAMCGPFNLIAHISDLVSWNLYLGWYIPGLFLNDLWMNFFHWFYPKRPLGFSEYGAEGMPNLHSGHPRRGDHTEEYQAKYHEFMLRCFERHKFLWSTYVWNMFDFAADARNQGGEPGMNHKGLVTFDRKIKKDSFYLYKAWWSDEPFVHLAGKRYEYRSEKKTEIVVYSNCKEVSLYNNGRLVETKRGEHAFHFKVILDEKNEFEVKAGELSDRAVIYKCRKKKAEYKVKKGKSQNWV